MIFELLFSIVLFLFAGYCLFYITTSVAVSTVSDPLGSALWPQILLVLLMITLLLNMYWLIKKAPKGESIWAPIKKRRLEKSTDQSVVSWYGRHSGICGNFEYNWFFTDELCSLHVFLLYSWRKKALGAPCIFVCHSCRFIYSFLQGNGNSDAARYDYRVA